MDNSKIELATAIGELRRKLFEARKEGIGQTPRLIIEEAEIELKVGITAGADGRVGVKFWVYSAEAGGKLEREAVQTIRLKLRPEHADGGKYDTSGTAPLPPQSDSNQ